MPGAFLGYLKGGTVPERAGAARAWYWAQVALIYRGNYRSPTPESKAEFDLFADLRRDWREATLRVFVTDDDLDVRRCILPGLSLRAQNYPEELRPMVKDAIRIARTDPDEYLRHQVEH